MAAALEIAGKRFGRLVALRRVGATAAGKSIWAFECDCGAEHEAVGSTVVNGHVSSCGCLRRERLAERSRRHGHTVGRAPSAEYLCWQNMLARVHGRSHPEHYRDRGITVCTRWERGEGGKSGFECFFMDMGLRPSPAHTLERQDNAAGYNPGNCRWATKSEQARNRRVSVMVDYRGQRLHVEDAVKLAGVVSAHVARYRLRHGWATEQALETPADITDRAKRGN